MCHIVLIFLLISKLVWQPAIENCCQTLLLILRCRTNLKGCVWTHSLNIIPSICDTVWDWNNFSVCCWCLCTRQRRQQVQLKTITENIQQWSFHRHVFGLWRKELSRMTFSQHSLTPFKDVETKLEGVLFSLREKGNKSRYQTKKSDWCLISHAMSQSRKEPLNGKTDEFPKLVTFLNNLPQMRAELTTSLRNPVSDSRTLSYQTTDYRIKCSKLALRVVIFFWILSVCLTSEMDSIQRENRWVCSATTAYVKDWFTIVSIDLARKQNSRRRARIQSSSCYFFQEQLAHTSGGKFHVGTVEKVQNLNKKRAEDVICPTHNLRLQRVHQNFHFNFDALNFKSIFCKCLHWEWPQRQTANLRNVRTGGQFLSFSQKELLHTI